MQKKAPVEVSFEARNRHKETPERETDVRRRKRQGGICRILLGLLAWMLIFYKAFPPENWLPEEEKEDQANGAQIGSGSSPEEAQIRVVLMDTGYRSYYHPAVTVSCKGKTVALDTDSKELETGSYTLDAGTDGFSVLSIERDQGIPTYQGSLTIYKEKEGLVLVNTLPMETYLKSVLPSEMPANYEREALKAQAVCARTYAGKQIQAQRMRQYHADVDDSTACQVYGNIQREETTDQAVSETDGLVLEQAGELIEAYYFSTSSGQTSTNEIWKDGPVLPYLQSVPCTYDSEYPWAGWQVEIPWNLLEERLPGIPGMGEEGDPKEQADTVSGRGISLKGLEITEKSQSGAAVGLTLALENTASGEDAPDPETFLQQRDAQKREQPEIPEETVTISGEYEIRKFLGPAGCMITRRSGDTVMGGELLPSAYISIYEKPGDSVLIHGAGYGHGVGMSQNAANEMAKAGFSCEEILSCFFRNVEICPYHQRWQDNLPQ